MLPRGAVRKVTEAYMVPLFEQNWAMFSVPGASNKIILVKYRLAHKNSPDIFESDWLDISSPILETNKHHYFSLVQRHIKYTSECINDIYTIANKAIDTIEKDPLLHRNDTLAASYVLRELNENSLGYASLKLYLRQVLETLHVPGKEKYDSITFATRIIDDAFPNYSNRQKDFFNENNHTYTEFKIDYAKLF